MVYGLLNQPPRLPFSDWRAQVERIIERKIGAAFRMHDNNATRAYFNAGVSAREAADDFAS